MPTDSRYYFLPSLPMLRFNAKAPFDWNTFVEYSEDKVSAGDFALIKKIEKGDFTGNSFLKQWKKFCDTTDKAINEKRKVNLGKLSQSNTELDFDTAKLVNTVMNAKNPLDAEMAILKYKYNYLEEKLANQAFSQEAVLGYALKLKLILRKDLFTAEAGNEQYKILFDRVKEEINVD